MNNDKNILLVIPARYGSSRFPGKPLANLAGKPMLQHVWEIANSVCNNVVIATDDTRIIDAANNFGANAVLTSECENGTERVYQVVQQQTTRPDFVVNFQGDAPLTPSWILQDLINSLDSNTQIATPAHKLSLVEAEELENHKQTSKASGTTVVFDKNYNALYFSKHILPFNRDGGDIDVYKHIGIYAYRTDILEQYLKLPISKLEDAEKLEQLRALENGIKIKVVPVDLKGRKTASVDTAEDLTKAKQILAEQVRFNI